MLEALSSGSVMEESIPFVLPRVLKPGPVPVQEVALVLFHLNLTCVDLSIEILLCSRQMIPSLLHSKVAVGGTTLVMVILSVVVPWLLLQETE